MDHNCIWGVSVTSKQPHKDGWTGGGVWRYASGACGQSGVMVTSLWRAKVRVWMKNGTTDQLPKSPIERLGTWFWKEQNIFHLLGCTFITVRTCVTLYIDNLGHWVEWGWSGWETGWDDSEWGDTLGGGKIWKNTEWDECKVRRLSDWVEWGCGRPTQGGVRGWSQLVR